MATKTTKVIVVLEIDHDEADSPYDPVDRVLDDGMFQDLINDDERFEVRDASCYSVDGFLESLKGHG